MDAYFSETIGKDEMLCMKERYDRETTELETKMQAVREIERIHQEQQDGLGEMMKTMRAGLTNSEEVFAEVIESVTIFEEYIEAKVQYLPMTFRLWYSTKGVRERYTTTINRGEIM